MTALTPPATPQERILAAAKSVFAARGYRGGSLNDVAVLAGYTRAGLLHHYPSKESILLALLEERDRQLADLVPEENEDVGVLTLFERLVAATDFVLADRELVQLAHLLTAEASGSDHPAREWVATRQRRFRQTLTRAIRHSIQAGELPASLEPELLAAVLFGMFEGLEAQWLVDEGVDPRRGHEAVLEILKEFSRRPTN